MNILVTGRNGQLGSSVFKLSKKINKNFFFSDRTNFDLEKLHLLKKKLQIIKPEYIINCAAFTDVEKAEANFELANTVNNEAIAIIADWTFKNECKLIHISTDYVYSDSRRVPIDENHSKCPVNQYGITKLAGEKACIYHNPNSLIIRTSWLYSEFGNNFVKKIIKKIKSDSNISVVDDEFGSPTYALDLAEAVFEIIFKKKWVPGVYNFSNKGEISRFEFAYQICNIMTKKNINIKRIKSEKNKYALRPKYSALDSSKIIKEFGIKQKHYLESLEKFIKLYQNEL